MSVFVGIIIGLLSAVFSLALFYLTVELPRYMHQLLLGIVPDYFLMWDIEGMQQALNFLRIIGAICLVIIIALIILGFIFKKGSLSILGSFVFFLPTFGYFAFSMFFLAGIGALRALWLPFLEVNPNIINSCVIVLLPFLIINTIVAILYGASIPYVAHTNILVPASLVIIFLGILIFTIGVSTWLYGKYKGIEIIDFWIYRYSRHPQYLGYIIWSYGLLVLSTGLPAPKGGYVPPPTLIWTIQTLVVLVVAEWEEMFMEKEYGEKYIQYREKTPFLLPLPNIISRLFRYPSSIIERHGRKLRYIILSQVVNLIIIIAVSSAFIFLAKIAGLPPSPILPLTL